MLSLLSRRLGAITILVLSFALALVVIKYQPQLENYIRSANWIAFPVAIAIFAVVASAPFSVTDAIAIMNGALFGPLWGSVVNAIGLVLAAIMGYYINRHATHLLDLEKTLERLPMWAKRFRIGSPAFLLTIRIIPGLGGTLATSVAAAFRVPLWVHVWTMCAIAVPICTLLAIFGDRVTEFVHRSESRVYTRAHEFYERHKFHRHHTPEPIRTK